MDSSFLSDQIAKTKEIIIAYNAAILALLSGNHQKYMLNTGQSETQVTRFDLKDLQETRRQLYTELQDLENRAGGSGAVITVVPDF
jgi:hypothetical protein